MNLSFRDLGICRCYSLLLLISSGVAIFPPSFIPRPLFLRNLFFWISQKKELPLEDCLTLFLIFRIIFNQRDGGCPVGGCGATWNWYCRDRKRLFLISSDRFRMGSPRNVSWHGYCGATRTVGSCRNGSTTGKGRVLRPLPPPPKKKIRFGMEGSVDSSFSRATLPEKIGKEKKE